MCWPTNQLNHSPTHKFNWLWSVKLSTSIDSTLKKYIRYVASSYMCKCFGPCSVNFSSLGKTLCAHNKFTNVPLRFTYYLLLWSILRAFSTLLGSSVPYLCIICLAQDVTALMIMFHFLRVYGSHQEKAASSTISLDFANSATLTGWDSFMSLRLIQDSVLSANCTKSFQDIVVLQSLLCLLAVESYLSSFKIVMSSLLFGLILRTVRITQMSSDFRYKSIAPRGHRRVERTQNSVVK